MVGPRPRVTTPGPGGKRGAMRKQTGPYVVTGSGATPRRAPQGQGEMFRVRSGPRGSQAGTILKKLWREAIQVH